jgi:hypothetical protein
MRFAITECGQNAMRSLYLMAAILTPLAACASEEESSVNLSLACQLNKCVCAGPDKLFVKSDEPEPVLWRDNGDAYCRDGLELKLAEE